jgi:conjugative transposon TraK protein
VKKENVRAMFTRMKNIDTAFRSVRRFALVCITGCLALSVFIAYKSYELVRRAEKKIYVLAGGKVLEAYAAERGDNIAVEARDHVKMFHHYFFTLGPDDGVIQEGIGRALYLADGSAKRQYDDLKEAGYYSGLISGNISQEIKADSILVQTGGYPYYFRYTGRQKIIRPTSVITRSLVTEGYLRSVSRSDNNPHGFLIEKWRTLENRDLAVQNR